jgi:hypothetical protein
MMTGKDFSFDNFFFFRIKEFDLPASRFKNCGPEQK